MGQQFAEISAEHRAFIARQKIFFVGTATADSKVNISPKGLGSLAVLGPQRVVWLNVTGSGNETSAHVQCQPRMTLMFAAFDGEPLILRLYGQAQVVHHRDERWDELAALLPALPGARQIFDLKVEMVQTSCGMSVPLYDYVAQREQLTQWARARGPQGVQEYWQTKNQVSLDGIPTRVTGPDD